ncbi:MAG: DUF6382 domain-containing protein [Dorea sp.]|nr:DUF6382 domain-containing protein [Dorea sp.]
MERKIRIEDQKIYHEDYQLRMIHENAPWGLLPVTCHIQEETSIFDYNVTGKSSMKAIYEKNEIGWKELISFLEQLLLLLREMEKYLLDIHCILLKPEYIFYEEERYYFCYYPCAEQNFWEEFLTLTQYFVKKADFKDELCAKIVCILNTGAMEENYSLEKLLAECKAEEKKAMERDSLYVLKTTIKKDDMFCEDRNYLQLDDDEEEKGEKEGASFWSRVFGRKKKSRWGDWEDF